MAANGAISLTGVDFDEIKYNLKQYLKSQDVLKDANYEGSALSILLDVLAYNTHYNAHYLNYVANEMFLDTATKRNSVVSHAKHLGYLPYSYSAPTATIKLDFYGVTAEQIILPKYTKFLTETIDNVNYAYVTLDEYIIKTNTTTNIATLDSVVIKQGEPLSYSFAYSEVNNKSAKFKIPDANIDLSTLTVFVQNSSTDIRIEVFNYPQDKLNINGDSKIYFLQEGLDGYYEIYFGDGILGKRLTDGNIIRISYLSVSPTIIQNVSDFNLVSTSIGDYSYLEITTLTASNSGRYKESINSIRNIAPKAYQAQERAVTTNDYIALIQKNSGEFPVDSVNVWSGEENNPPVYGRIFVALKPKGSFIISENQKNRIIEDIIKPISVLTVQPVIVDADYVYLNVIGKVLYDKNKTLLSSEQLKTKIIGNVKDYGTENLNTFNSTLIVPDIITTINNSDDSIITNELDIYLEKRIIPTLRTALTYSFDFEVPIKRDIFRKSVKIEPSFQMISPTNSSIIRQEVYIEEVPTSATSIQSIEIINPGYGYKTVPTVTITGDGSGAEARAIIVNERIESIEIVNAGINYTQAIVTITGDGKLGQARVILQNQYGNLRSYYFMDGVKIIMDSNIGTVDYLNGIVTLNNFNIYEVNNFISQIKVMVIPDTSIITSKYDKIIVLDRNDSNSVKITLSSK